uniref:Thioredoxin domain-containing protein n=1 Tax=Panagrolaimus sp. ES5 TaxID=591445 RepID=A0AC34GR41_9BILA
MLAPLLRPQGIYQFARYASTCSTSGKHFLGSIPLKKGDGSADASKLSKKPLILYFSAGWCKSCKMFTPKLREFYENYKGNDLNIVWISRDRSAEDQLEYYKKSMPDWYYVPYGDEIQNLLKKYEVKTIPAVKVVNDNGEVIDDGARMKIEKGETSPEKLAEEWKKNL